MEFLEGPSSHTTQIATRKKRSQIPRRPRNVSLEFQIYDRSTDDVSQVHTNYRTKEFNLNHFSVFGSQETSSSHSTVIGDENKVKRVKLKVGSVTHTIETKYSSFGVLSCGSSKVISRNTESAQSRHKLILQLLTRLDLSWNRLNGTIPKSMVNFRRLATLDLSHNFLVGDIHALMIASMKILQIYLDLSNNLFVGPVPSELSMLDMVQEIDLSQNNLSGNIPETLKGCRNLFSLDFSGNKLNGSIPSFIFQLTNNLESLNFSVNQLDGLIPEDLVNLKHLSSIDLSQNKLNGRIPEKLANDKSDDNFLPPYKKTGVRRISFKNSSYRGREDSSKKLSNKHDPNGEFDEADEDDEIRYLKKLKLSKFVSGSEHSDEEPSKKIKRISRCSNNAKLDDFSEELVSSRSSRYSASEIEFPNGLPPAPKKQKEKLSVTDQQLKKAEAAQRRRMQAEKAARESEAEAIRKILGQDSNRKKKEDKVKKRVDDMAQKKAANALTLASKTVRWVMGPAGTVVSFSDDLGLPSIFNFSPCNYPDPRENCAGPSCGNPYKYRDSKSKLPLCSLNCYKAVREKVQNQAIV